LQGVRIDASRTIGADGLNSICRVNVYVYPTDRDWFQFLSREPSVDEVNFWRPGGKQPFRQLQPGDLFLFRLGAPDAMIAGGGTYTHFSFAPIEKAWEAFGRKNGTADYDTFLRLLGRYKRRDATPEQVAGENIGCIVLTAPFFLPRARWIGVPPEYEVNSPQGQRFDGASATGQSLLAAMMRSAQVSKSPRVSEYSEVAMRYGESIVKRRLGQGGFSLVVADAYEKRCAVSGERTYPVLEAAHIVPVSRGGLHRPDNGLLLRSDIHKLFDRGYVTVRPSGDFAVSPRLREDWQNGRIYYELDGHRVRMPDAPALRPNAQYLEWHNDVLFKR
jgi:putative restriction endonuclease